MHYLENAKKLKEHLGELNRFSHDILQMEQETISEIRSYHHPPKGVKEVMLSTYLVLGYEESKLRVIIYLKFVRVWIFILKNKMTNIDTKKYLITISF